jgi:glycosyltransferase involved in cell wall biosynthesis
MALSSVDEYEPSARRSRLRLNATLKAARRSRPDHCSSLIPIRVLIVAFYFPPAGGVGVERPLKLSGHLADLGVEVHLLAPDDPRWVHRDEHRPIPPGVSVHRARYLGPRGRMPAQELYGTTGLRRLWRKGSLLGRRLLMPDENIAWVLTAVPAAKRLVREHSIDVVITTSPPNSNHLVGRAVQRSLGVTWLADLRDPVVAHPHRHVERRLVRLKEHAQRLVVHSIDRADGVICVSHAIAEEIRKRRPHAVVEIIPNGADFDDFDGLECQRNDRFVITHAGSFFGSRDPRPFLTALAQVDDVTARFVGDFRPADRAWLEQEGLDGRVELVPYATHRRSLELQRASAAVLLLIPDSDGRGRQILSGKVYEYLASGRPILAAVPTDGAAAELMREIGAGVVVGPDDVDGMVRALTELRDRWRADELEPVDVLDEWRQRISWRSRAEDLQRLLITMTGGKTQEVSDGSRPPVVPADSTLGGRSGDFSPDGSS